MNPLVILTGPTGAGKTGLSLKLAKKINAEIISADSMQVYKHMDIGTDKILPDEMQGIPHYLIDCFEPSDEFNVTVFKATAKNVINDIYSRGKLPLVVGGTGFYIQALLYDVDFSDNAGTCYRDELNALAAERGSGFLYRMLEECDSKAASYIAKNDVRRITRALEYYHETGKRISDHNEEERNKTSSYDFRYFVLNKPREQLYADIDKRVDEMIKKGLVEEVKYLKDMGCDRSMVSMHGLGYKEILAYLDGDIELTEAVRIIKRDTRHFAKRQLTWFRRERDVIWINKNEFGYDDDRILEYILSFV
jgi:tRNA dimethylallyltransferase